MLEIRLRAISLFRGEESKTNHELEREAMSQAVTLARLPSPRFSRKRETARILVLKQSNAKTMVLQHEKLTSLSIEYDVLTM